MRPTSWLDIVGFAQSSTRPTLPEDEQKSGFDDITHDPFVGGQINFKTNFLNRRPGNYRVYGWFQPYEHPFIEGNGQETGDGWGVGMSVDQMITSWVGVWGRFGSSNNEVYASPWYWSSGLSFFELVPGREADSFALGVAGAPSNADSEDDFDLTEYHFEMYYRFVLNEYFALTPDLQYVIQPQGSQEYDNVFAYTLRLDLTF